MLVQEMQLAQLPQVCALAKELGYPSEEAQLFERYKRLKNLKNHALFVALIDNTVQGFIHLEVVDDLLEEVKIEIKALVVNQKMQGQGIGHLLVRKAHDWALERNHGTLYLSCNILRERAHNFYEREGFEVQRTSHFYQKNVSSV